MKLFYKIMMLGLCFGLGSSYILCMEEQIREDVRQMNLKELEYSKQNLEKVPRKTEREEVQLRLVNEELARRNPVNWSDEQIKEVLGELFDHQLEEEEAGNLTDELREKLEKEQNVLIAEQERREKKVLSRPAPQPKEKSRQKELAEERVRPKHPRLQHLQKTRPIRKPGSIRLPSRRSEQPVSGRHAEVFEEGEKESGEVLPETPVLPAKKKETWLGKLGRVFFGPETGEEQLSNVPSAPAEEVSREEAEKKSAPPAVPSKGTISEKVKRGMQERALKKAEEKVLQEAAAEAKRQREEEARDQGRILRRELGDLWQALVALTHQLSY